MKRKRELDLDLISSVNKQKITPKNTSQIQSKNNGVSKISSIKSKNTKEDVEEESEAFSVASDGDLSIPDD